MLQAVPFSHPEPPGGSPSIWPVFIPFGGCTGRCIYCAQDLQTGTTAGNIASVFRDLRRNLEHALPSKPSPPEIGFFGGTFTRLPRVWQGRFLNLAAEYKERGLLARVRCSTRPDAVSLEGVREMKQLGLDMVELGVQSLDDGALRASRRGYSAETVRRACEIVRAQGLGLGLQMMAGLPGQEPSAWQREIGEVCRLRPDTVRIYPCLVLEGTPLSRIWARGEYRPWDTQETIRAASRATLRLWRNNIPVIRIGLPPEKSLLPHILAGPWHPALGGLVRSTILFHLLRSRVIQEAGKTVHGLDCPRRYQGELWGHRGVNRNRLGNLGISPHVVRFTRDSRFTLYFRTGPGKTMALSHGPEAFIKACGQ